MTPDGMFLLKRAISCAALNHRYPTSFLCSGKVLRDFNRINPPLFLKHPTDPTNHPALLAGGRSRMEIPGPQSGNFVDVYATLPTLNTPLFGLNISHR